MASLTTLLEEELRSEGPGDRLLRESLVRYAAGLLLQSHHPSGRRGRESVPFYRGIGRRAVEYMREHYSDDVTMADIATAAGMSISRFHRFFRQYTGVPRWSTSPPCGSSGPRAFCGGPTCPLCRWRWR